MGDIYMASESRRDWEHARRSAFVQDVLSTFTQRPADLLSFEEVRRRLELRNERYLGIQDVDLDHIVGSVGRYQDFTRAFFPRQDALKDRWRRISQLVTTGGGLAPVELYKVGQVYFVRDGNHRVSVARQQGAPTIEAYVWEYETRVSLEPDTDAEDLLCKAAHAAFVGRTDIDRICPDTSLELTEPDGYEDLLHEIETFQEIISQIDEREVDLYEAVALWCEMRYTPIVETIRRRDILQEFPGRTEADLYLWLRRNQEELQVRYEHQVLMEEAADDLAQRFGGRPSPARQIKEVVGRLVGSIAPGDRVRRTGQAQEDKEDAVDAVAAALLAPVRRVATATPPYRFRGTTRAEWEAWRAEFREQLWNLLGVGDSSFGYPFDKLRAGSFDLAQGRPWKAFGPSELRAEVEERIIVDRDRDKDRDRDGDGLRRELIWLSTEENGKDHWADAQLEGRSRQSLRVPVYLFLPPEVGEDRQAGENRQAGEDRQAQADGRGSPGGRESPGGPQPAVVVFPGHGTIAQTAGLDRSRSSYQRANALELARAGFVTLTVEPRGFGRLGALDHLQIDAAARLVGRTWYGMLVQDGMRAIDYLLTRPEVDPARIGVTGIGAGGALAMYIAALDDRVQVVLVNSYLGKYVVTSLDEEHCPCNDIPGMLRYAEMGDVAALIAPRPVMFVNGRRDPATNPTARESFAIVSQMYRFLGLPRHAMLIEPEEMGHYFDNQLAIGWFRRWLLHRS